MDTAPQDRSTYACPSCGMAAGVEHCPHCGRGPSPVLRALAQIDTELGQRKYESQQIRAQLATVTDRIQALQRKRRAVTNELNQTLRTAMAQRQSAAGAEMAPPPPPAVVAPPPAPKPLPVPAEDRSGARTPEASTRSVQNVLLSLGGVLSAAAIIVFTAVAWATFGAIGRAGILTVITIALMIVPLWIARRGLAATAETVAGLAILMVPCDAVALYLLRLFPTEGSEPIIAEPATREFGGTLTTALTTGVHTPGIAIGLLVITGIAMAYRMLTRMIVPGFAVAGLGLLTLVIAVVQSSTALGTGVLVGAAAIQALAARLFGRHPTRRGRTAGKVLVHTCGALAVVMLLTAVGFGTGRVAPAYPLLAVAAAAAVLLVITQRLPGTWRGGPVWTVRVALAGTAVTAVGLALVVAVRWLLLPLPPWRADMDVPGWPLDDRYPFGWRLTATIVILTIVAAALLPERDRLGTAKRPATRTDGAGASTGTSSPSSTESAQSGSGNTSTTVSAAAAGSGGASTTQSVASTGSTASSPSSGETSAVPHWQVRRLVLALTGGVLAVLTVPPALGLSWRAGALLLAVVALGVVGGSLAVKDRRLSTALLLSAIPLGLNAVILSIGGAGTMLTVLLALFGCLAILSALTLLRGRPAQSGALAGIALWTLVGALPVSWHLLGLSPSHIAALAGILAAVVTLAAAYLLTHPSTANYRLFATWARYGGYGGIATAAVAAVVVHGSAPKPLFVVIAGIAAIPLLLTTAVSLETTARLPLDASRADPVLTRNRRLCTGLGTIALLLWLGAYVSMWTPADTLPGYVILALVAAALAKVLPRRLGDGPDWGSWTVAGLASGFAAAAAISTVPTLFGRTPPLPWLDWRTPILFAVVAAASLVLLPSGWRRGTATAAATLGLLCVPVAWPTPWWAGPALFVAIAVVYAVWTVYAPSTDRNTRPTASTDPTGWVPGREPETGTAAAGTATSGPEAGGTTADPVGSGSSRSLGADATASRHETAGTVANAGGTAIGQRSKAANSSSTAGHGHGAYDGRTAESRRELAIATQWTRGLLALGFAALGLAAAALHPAAPSRPAGFGLTAILSGLLVLVCAGIAVLAYRRRPTIGGVAVATGLVLLPGSVVMAGLSLRLAAEPIQLGAMAAACFGLLVAAALRFGAPRYLRWATLVVPPVAVACARAGLPSHQSGMYVAVAGLVGVGAAMLMLPNRRAAAIRTGLASIAITATLIKVLPLSVATLALPYRWVSAAWTETPLTTVAGLTPGGTAPRILAEATGWDLAILTVCVTTIALAILGLTGRGWGIGATFVAVAIALPTVPVVFDLPWPALPFTALAIAVAAYVLSTHIRLPASQLSILGVVAVVCCGTGLTGSLAAKGTTLTALAVLSIGTLTGGLLGASPARRATGWLLSSVTVTGLVTATAFAADLPPSRLPYGIVAVAALFLALASARTPLTGPATWAAETAGHLVAVTAIAAAAGVSATTAATVSTPALVLVIYGALLGLLAVRATPEDDEPLLASKRWYTAGSITAAFAAYWLLLADARVSVIEVYTVPFALATLLAGWLELRRRPKLSSWTAYGPGLCLLLLPPLAQILLTEDEPLRRLGLGVASIAILLLGTRQQFQAPVVVATAMLVVQAGYEITLLWTLVPSWLPLAIGGVLLLTLGATFEKRRRDLRRLRGAIADMR